MNVIPSFVANFLSYIPAK